MEDIVTKDALIEKINSTIAKHGDFGVQDVLADHSPSLMSKGRLAHLAEAFRDGDCTVRVYDPSSHDSNEIDSYDESYDEFEVSQLEYILELAEAWAEQEEE